MTATAPPRNFGHDDRRIPNAGGIRSDSEQGSRDAAAAGLRWIDCDGQLMHRRAAGVAYGRLDRDLVWVNAHGAPFLPDYIKGRFEDHAYGPREKREGLRTARETFTDNAALGLNTEWEVKDVRPFTSQRTLDYALELLAADARAAYGEHWQQHVEVKVLNTLHGGLRYALRVLRAAKRAGFTTMLLNHSRRPVVIGPIRARYIDMVRGPWRKRGRR